MTAHPNDAGPQPVPVAVARPLPRMGISKGLTISAVVALFVAMGEISRLSGQVLDDAARTWSFSTLMGPGRVAGLAEFGRWPQALAEGWTGRFPAYGAERSTWLGAYLVLDVVLIALYGGVVATWLAPRWPMMARLLRVLAVVDLLEDGSAFVTSRASNAGVTALGVATGVLSAVKWLLVVGGLVLLLKGAAEPRARQVAGSWLRALYQQRFSILAILPIAVLSIPSGSDLLDQLPDVQRRWLADGKGVTHFLLAVVVVVVVTLGVLLLGRLRSGALLQRTPESVLEERPAVLRLGLLAPAVVVLGVVVIAARGGGAPWSMPGLAPVRTAIFLAVPVVILGVSWFVRARLAAARAAGRTTWFTRSFQPAHHLVPSDDDKTTTVLAGDILTAVSVVVAALGLVRSFTAVVALAGVGLGGSGWAVLPLALGAGAAVLAWPLTRWVCDRVTNESLAGGDRATRSRRHRLQAVLTPSVPVPESLPVRLGVLVAGVLLYFLVGYFPTSFGSTVGVIGTSLLALLAATLVVGGSVVAVQDRLAPELFWHKWIRLRSLPVTTILLGTIAFTTGIGSNLDIHGLRGLGPGDGTSVDVAARPTMAAALDDWTTATAGCGHSVTSGAVTYRLRPMFLLAAEGGGIRAAYWTAAGLDIFRGAATPHGDSVDWSASQPANHCARAVFAGGASGGAVGMAVARFAGDGLARDAAAAMAAPDALAAATSGLFVRDTAYSATGLPFFGTPDYARALAPNSPTWLDRAGLIETSWQATSGLGVPFLPTDPRSAASAVTGSLILNSTRVSDGCRMFVSQVRLASGDEQACDFTSTPAGHTIDLLAALAALAPLAPPGAAADGAGADGDHCVAQLTAATGAMLASRFPFVTPSGVAGACAGQPEQQLVDGGYVENSGLATIVDLAPSWLQEVQRRNTTALRTRAAVVDVIVPVVMYFDNGTGGDLVVDPPGPTSEVLVPSTTSGRAKTALIDTPALLRNSARIIAAPYLFEPDASGTTPGDLAAQIDRWRPKPVVVVHQSTFPSVSAPLGWVLSTDSIATMDRALAQQATAGDPTSPVRSVTANGSLQDALRLVRPDAS